MQLAILEIPRLGIRVVAGPKLSSLSRDALSAIPSSSALDEFGNSPFVLLGHGTASSAKPAWMQSIKD